MSLRIFLENTFRPLDMILSWIIAITLFALCTTTIFSSKPSTVFLATTNLIISIDNRFIHSDFTQYIESRKVESNSY